MLVKQVFWKIRNKILKSESSCNGRFDNINSTIYRICHYTCLFKNSFFITTTNKDGWKQFYKIGQNQWILAWYIESHKWTGWGSCEVMLRTSNGTVLNNNRMHNRSGRRTKISLKSKMGSGIDIAAVLRMSQIYEAPLCWPVLSYICDNMMVY